MRYSLSSRFRGTLIGILIGEMLVASTNPQLVNQVILGTKSLISRGRFDVDDWQSVFSQDSTYSLQPSTQSSGAQEIFTQAIAATVPIALFYHDSEAQLRQNLLLVAAVKEQPEIQDNTLALGYVIAQSLKEKLHWAKLIPQIINFLGESSPDLSQKLIEINILREHNAGLEQAMVELGSDAELSTSIALALYCCLTTPEDFRLCIKRAVQTNYLTTAITGALSGAHNSIAGIPANLRLALSRHNSTSRPSWEMTSTTEMLELSDSLVAVWSGVYDQAACQADSTQISAAIAAPRVIR